MESEEKEAKKYDAPRWESSLGMFKNLSKIA